jgi:SPP1 gp7 family putative phage head morphogenesis protein
VTKRAPFVFGQVPRADARTREPARAPAREVQKAAVFLPAITPRTATTPSSQPQTLGEQVSRLRRATKLRTKIRRSISLAQKRNLVTRPPDGLIASYGKWIETFLRWVDAELIQELQSYGIRLDAADKFKTGDLVQPGIDQAVYGPFKSEINRAVGNVTLRMFEKLKHPEYQKELREIAEKVTAHNKRGFDRMTETVIGIKVRSEPILGHTVDGFITRNLSLIKSLSADHLHKAGNVINASLGTGERAESLSRKIQEETGASVARANLIARDQVLKFNSSVTQSRQKAAGISKYEWITSDDERVRESHADMHGTIHKWDDPPIVDGEAVHPGEAIQCRCDAFPILDELADFDAAAPAEQDQEPEPEDD